MRAFARCSIALASCSRQQSDWQKTREANTAEAYEQFLKKYPTGEFTAQAQSRLKELSDVRDWQKARDADTPEAYQAYLKSTPTGKSAVESAQPNREFHDGADAGGDGRAGRGAARRPHRPPRRRTRNQLPRPRARAKLSTPPSAPAPGAAPHPAHPLHEAAIATGAVCRAARRLPLRQRRSEEALGAPSEAVPALAGRSVLPGGAQENRERNAVPAASGGHERGQARRICKDLKAKSQPCVIVRAEHT